MGTYLDRFRLSFVDPDPCLESVAWDWERLKIEYEEELNQIQLITDRPTPARRSIRRGRLKPRDRNKRYKLQESIRDKLRRLRPCQVENRNRRET